MRDFPSAYDHTTQEPHWQAFWRQHHVYAWQEGMQRADNYVIDTPPPTVSGQLHMGHIYSYVQADFVARYQRMQGKNVFYPMGFDDNGLPTERLVEKVKKIRATHMPREQFIAECASVAEEARAEFRTLFETVALSVDWQQEYHTISEDVRRISQQSFLDLLEKKHVYRREQPMLWDPVDQTAIAQAEVEDKEMPSQFCDIRFAVAGTDDTIIIATTRPEMLAACVAIFFHPEDARYQHLLNKQAIVPLFNITVPILADDTVEPDKGTGIMMCCTFGDEADIQKWRMHNLPLKLIINQYGKLESTDATIISAAAWQELAGKKTSAARTDILPLLEQAGALVGTKPITHAVKCAERSGAPLEIIPTPQWFVEILPHKEALKAKARTCDWKPAHMRIRVEQWIDGLNWDWCISRQRYFGVPFPVWYSNRAGEEGKILLPTASQLPVNPLVDLPEGYTREEVTPDMDVMDTWATSSISPQINAGGLGGTERFNQLFPADLRPQAHEIIRTWAFYTIVKAHLHHDSIPWKNLMISGWCLAADKTKMSKSKGNVVTPVALLEEKGTDSVRYWASTSRLGADTAYSEASLKIGRKLVTKLWNAARFVCMQLGEATFTTYAEDTKRITHMLDRWLMQRLDATIQKATQAFEAYEYADARAATEDFFWNDLCDNYLELVKARAGNGCDSARTALYYATAHVLRLFAPFVPHITEELHQIIVGNGSIHARGMWPKPLGIAQNDDIEQAATHLLALLEGVRKAKSEASLSIKYPVKELVIDASTQPHTVRDVLEHMQEDLMAAGNIATLYWKNLPGNADGTLAHQITLADNADAA